MPSGGRTPLLFASTWTRQLLDLIYLADIPLKLNIDTIIRFKGLDKESAVQWLLSDLGIVLHCVAQVEAWHMFVDEEYQ